MKIFEFLQDLNILSVAIRILLAVIAGGLIGYDRGRHGRAAGLRTHILISLGSAIAAMVGQFMVASYGLGGDPSRVAAGVVSGIGFLCAGIILVKNNSRVTGLTTAAAMWTTSTIGLAFGAGFYIAAIIGTAVLFVCLTLMTCFEIKQKKDRNYIIEIDDAREVNNIVSIVKGTFPEVHNFDILPAKSNLPGHVDISVNIDAAKPEDINKIKETEHVVFILGE